MAVKEVIKEVQPLVSLHGHIHESRAAERIGRTLAINPGSSYVEGTLAGVPRGTRRQEEDQELQTDHGVIQLESVLKGGRPTAARDMGSRGGSLDGV